MTVTRAVVRLVTSGATAAAGMRAAPHLPESWRRPWARTNHAGKPVTLLEGPVWVLGAVSGLAVPGSSGRRRAIALASMAGGLGLLDDLGGSSASKGLRGHLAALRRGEVTTGAVKLIGLAVSGVAATAAVDRAARGHAARGHAARGHAARGHRARGHTARGHGGPDHAQQDHVPPDRAGAGLTRRLVTTVVGGAVVAGTANLVNLLDLRPGRALKAVIVLGAPGALGSAPAAAAVGASVGVIADDLDARAMLGDTGANAAGALLGLALVERSGLAGRSLALAVLTALTLASERVSFSAVIDRQPLLRRLDQWGRPPTHAQQ